MVILSEVKQRVIGSDYTIRHEKKIFQIAREDLRPRMRGAAVRMETRRNGEVAARFEDRYLKITECVPAMKAAVQPTPPKKQAAGAAPREKSKWMDGFFQRPSPTLNKALKIANATS